MEFLEHNYHFINTEHGHGMSIVIFKKDMGYFAKSEFTHPKSGDIIRFETRVTISSNMYVESEVINVKKEFNGAGVEDNEWRINSRPVEAIKVKCKFKGKKMSTVSSILVLHDGMKKWVSYPFSMIGQLVTDD
tara:strand:- start:3365 stop:3763 length:399 start_codon:yes stop_codon:yes gene_type:complete